MPEKETLFHESFFNPKDINALNTLGSVLTWIILGWILERWDGVMWTGFIWLRIGTAVVNSVLNLRVP
jgi:hypothetical protein